MRNRIPHLWLFIAFAWYSLLVGLAYAAPAPLGSTETLYRRQENGSPITQTVVTQTVQTIDTPSGPATQTCTVTLSPVTGNNGEPLVQVVRQCTIVPGVQSSAAQTQTEPPSTSTVSTSLSSNAPPSSTSSPPPASTSSVDPGVSVIGLSSVPNPNPVATSTSSRTTPPSTKSSASNGTSAAADNTSGAASSSAAAAFQIPGKKISVLPIGLGIFAGISVIALIVVGLVTYERTKYRKIFRQRKLAEQGSSMGYS